MNLLPKMGKVLLFFAQWASYQIVWILGFTFAIAACLMGLSPFFIDEAGREFVKQHLFFSSLIFMAINAGAIAFLFLKRHLERRWPHVTL